MPTAWPGCRSLLNDLEDEHGVREGVPKVSRRFVQRFRDQLADRLLVASMVFGFGVRGYGPKRTLWMLRGRYARRSAAETRRRLEGIREASRRSSEEGFRALRQPNTTVPYLKTSMGTKFLYFAASGDGRRMPLILDANVLAAVERLAPDPSIRPALNGSVEAYRRYLEYCESITPSGGESDAIECALFIYGSEI